MTIVQLLPFEHLFQALRTPDPYYSTYNAKPCPVLKALCLRIHCQRKRSQWFVHIGLLRFSLYALLYQSKGQKLPVLPWFQNPGWIQNSQYHLT